jgi:hypothetical protein
MTDHPMPEYTADEKQALLADLLAEKALLEKWRDDWNQRDALNYRTICITLASLTAAPALHLAPTSEKLHGGTLHYECGRDYSRGRAYYTTPPVPTRSAPRRASAAASNKQLAKEIVAYLMDTGSADDEAIERSEAWMLKKLNTLTGQGK